MKAVTDTRYYDEIAKEINLLNKETESYLPSELTGGVRMVSENRYAEGYRDAETEGREAQYDEFWDDYQQNPNHLEEPPAISYMRAFQGARWTNNTFNPKYKIVATNLQATFYGNNRITEIPVLVDMSRITNSNYTSQSFYGCSSLQKLDLKVAATTPWNANTFQTCSALMDLTIDGTIGMNGFDVHWSTQLNDASLLSILQTCNKSAAGISITLPSTAEETIKNSTELSTAATTAGNNGYTILYD